MKQFWEYDPPNDRCYDCGSKDVCGSSGREALCPECWTRRMKERAERRQAPKPDTGGSR